MKLIDVKHTSDLFGEFRINGEWLEVFTKEGDWVKMEQPQDWEAVAAGQAMTIALLGDEIARLKENWKERQINNHIAEDLIRLRDKLMTRAFEQGWPSQRFNFGENCLED